MGNNSSGYTRATEDRDNRCPYYELGLKLGWTDNCLLSKYAEKTPEIFQEKEKEKEIEQIDSLTFLGNDIPVSYPEIVAANKAIHNFFYDSGIDPKRELQFDFVVVLAKLSKCRIREPINISKVTEMMIGHAKCGNFKEALKIMEKYPGIVNYIPAHRAWGLIHQAAYFNDYEAIETILHNPKCDPFLKTKIARDGKVAPSSTVYEIAKDKRVKEIIKKHQEVKRKEIKERSLETFVTIDSEKDLKVESILLMLNCFGNVLYPDTLQTRESLIYSNLMLDIFKYIDTGNRWERVRREISLQLQSINISDAVFLATGKDGDIVSEVIETKSSFYSRVIHLYTRECSIASDYSNKFYTALNFSFMTHGCKTSFVTGEDLGLAAYGALLNSILMYWGNLVPTNQPTYRGMNLTEGQIDKYKVGDTMTWLCFSSSSLDESMVKRFGSVTFIFDNSHLTKYAAKSIQHVSEFTNEEEFLFPSGVKFRTTHIQKKKGERLVIWVRLEDY